MATITLKPSTFNEIATGGKYVVFAGTLGCLPDYTSSPVDTLSQSAELVEWYVDGNTDWILASDNLSATSGIQQIWTELVTDDELSLMGLDD